MPETETRYTEARGSRVWAIAAPKYDELMLALHREGASGFKEADEISSVCCEDLSTYDAWPECAGTRLARSLGNVSVVPIRGMIGMHRGSDRWASVYADEISGLISSLAASESVGAIVLDIDSPGGIVLGTPELGEVIRGLRDTKPIYALANGEAASAAYWIGSQATRMFMTPSSKVGSIGVFLEHTDVSAALESAGVNKTFISAGEFKVEGNPFEPLSDAARVEMQASVDRYYSMFVGAVAKGRGVAPGVVKSDFGRGRMLGAPAALAAGMVDGIATMPEILSVILRPKRGGNRKKAQSIAANMEIDDMSV